jgi:hypothetical protein
MFVRMISTAAGPRLPHCLNAGLVYELDDELGEELVKGRAAVEVPNPKKVPAVETAAVDAGEKAVAEGGEKKGDGKLSLMDKLTAGEKSGEPEDESEAEKPEQVSRAGSKSAKK